MLGISAGIRLSWHAVAGRKLLWGGGGWGGGGYGGGGYGGGGGKDFSLHAT